MSAGISRIGLLATITAAAGIGSVALTTALHAGTVRDRRAEASYARQAEALCQRGNNLAAELQPERPSTVSEVEDQIRASVPLVDDLAKGLRRLRPAHSQRRSHAQLVQAAEEELATLELVRDKLTIADLATAFALLRPLGNGSDRFAAAARDLHLDACASAPRQRTPTPGRRRLLARLQGTARARAAEGRIGPTPALAPDGSQSKRGSRLPSAFLYLVPMDGVPLARMRKLAADLNDYLEYAGYRWRIMPRLHTEKRNYDPKRRQIAADNVLGQVETEHPIAVEGRGVAIVAVTDGDLYWSKTQDRFVLGLREATVDGLSGWGVVSTARLDPRNHGLLPDDRLFRQRLKKMVARYVGAFMFRISLTSDDPHSLFRAHVPSVGDLDGMTDRFCRKQPWPLVSPAC